MRWQPFATVMTFPAARPAAPHGRKTLQRPRLPSAMAKGIDPTATASMEAGKLRAQQAEVVARIVKGYEGRGLAVAQVVQMKAVLLGVVTSGGDLTSLEQRAVQERWPPERLLSEAQQIRARLQPPRPRPAAAPVAPTRREPQVLPCPKCGKLVQEGDTGCAYCRVPLVWRGGRPYLPF